MTLYEAIAGRLVASGDSVDLFYLICDLRGVMRDTQTEQQDFSLPLKMYSDLCW